MDRRARARELLSSALAEVEKELSAPRTNLCPNQLGTARETLRGYLATLDTDALPPRRDRAEGLGRMILDSWPYDSPLGTAILQAERAWRNC
ncbi:MAG TPA: hypothetical protein VLU43_06650 [Anaeromyxobacteraceae bacterium]|nr:hypothetical protein [Anaeromyxobacteraceae bacterium]